VITGQKVGILMGVGSAAAIAIERIVAPIERMHRSISQRWFLAIGPAARPVASVHNAVARSVYISIQFAAAIGGAGVDRVVDVRPAVADRTQAVINGIWGDSLGHHAERLEVPMGLRDRAGKPIAVEDIASAYPTAGPNVVFLVHGFADTERCWLPVSGRPGLHDVLETNSQLTPVLVRFNTGKSLAENGRLLARLLEDCISVWPVPVQTVAAVGHSMGGLVIRSALTAGKNLDHSWVTKASNIVTLGSPHLGTPIEKLVSGLAVSLGIARDTVPLQEFIDTRSEGIKDLRLGLAGHELPSGIAHHFVAGVVTDRVEHPVGAAVGDLVVRVPSATAGSEAKPSSSVVAGGLRHNDLVRNEEVIAQVVAWLEPTR
jgi:pimeloyl-ACP methyl ester carboxylesterase